MVTFLACYAATAVTALGNGFVQNRFNKTFGFLISVSLVSNFK